MLELSRYFLEIPSIFSRSDFSTNCAKCQSLPKVTVTFGLGPLAVVHCLQNLEVQHNKPPKLVQLVIHPLAIFFRNLHLVFLRHFLTL